MKKFPYKPPQKPASGKVEYVPLVETLVGGSAQVARLGFKAGGDQLKSLVYGVSAETLKKAHENKGKGVEGLKKTFFKEGGKMPLKKKYQSGGGPISKYDPQPSFANRAPVLFPKESRTKEGPNDKRLYIRQAHKGSPTREAIRQDIIAESRKNYESGSKRIKAVLSAASNIPVVGKFAQAAGIGADLAAGLGKTIRGESGAKKDFSQAAVGSVALANPFKGVKGLKRAKAFLKSAEISNDVSDVVEGASTYKKGGKMPLKKASGKGKAAVQKAVSANIAELTRANREKPAGKKRSKEQIAAIAYSAARKK